MTNGETVRIPDPNAILRNMTSCCHISCDMIESRKKGFYAGIC